MHHVLIDDLLFSTLEMHATNGTRGHMNEQFKYVLFSKKFDFVILFVLPLANTVTFLV